MLTYMYVCISPPVSLRSLSRYICVSMCFLFAVPERRLTSCSRANCPLLVCVCPSTAAVPKRCAHRTRESETAHTAGEGEEVKVFNLHLLSRCFLPPSLLLLIPLRLPRVYPRERRITTFRYTRARPFRGAANSR